MVGYGISNKKQIDMTIDNLISWLQESEDNNTWLVSTQSVKRHLEKIKETEQLNIPFVSGSFLVERMKLASKIREHLESVGVKGLGKDTDLLIEQCLVQDGGRIFKNDR